MSPQSLTRIGSISLMALLVSSLLVLANSGDSIANSESLNSVTAESGSNRFVVWHDDTPGNFDIFFKRSTDNGATWKPTKNLSTNPGISLNQQITVLDSNVYVVWVQQATLGGPTDIFFRRSTDNGATWGPKVKISTSGTNSDSDPQVAALGSSVYVVWDDFQGSPESDVFLRRSTDNGANWNPVQNLTTNPGMSYSPQIALTGSNVYLVWSQDDASSTASDVFFRRSTDNGANWGPKVKLSTHDVGMHNFTPRIKASDSSVYVVWRDYFAGDNDIFFKRSINSGSAWQPVKNISRNDGNSDLPAIAVSGSSVHVVWLDNSPGNDEIFFKRSTDNGAIWSPPKNLSNNLGASGNPHVQTT